jgi:hypothetical protein
VDMGAACPVAHHAHGLRSERFLVDTLEQFP